MPVAVQPAAVGHMLDQYQCVVLQVTAVLLLLQVTIPLLQISVLLLQAAH